MILTTACLMAVVSYMKAPAANIVEASDVFTPTITDNSSYSDTPQAATLSDSPASIAVAASLSDLAKDETTDKFIENEPVKTRSKLRKHFTWGIDLGASIDLSGEDMSTFDAETYFGYKGSWVRVAAIGAGMHKAFGNKYTFIPLYAMLRTSFRSQPSLLFFEMKLGYSFNTLNDSGSFGGAYGSFGLGVNLAMSKSFQSHIVLAYSYFTLRNATDLDIPYTGDNINSAVLRFGINF